MTDYSLKNDIKQANELLVRVHAALDAFDHRGSERYTEDEVLFRHEAIRGILLMAMNDVTAMRDFWQEEDEKLSAARAAVEGKSDD